MLEETVKIRQMNIVFLTTLLLLCVRPARLLQTGQTALHLAVRHGRVVMVRLLLSCGADTNIQDSQGTTALMFASERGHTHIARLLLERSQCDLTLTDKVILQQSCVFVVTTASVRRATQAACRLVRGIGCSLSLNQRNHS